MAVKTNPMKGVDPALAKLGFNRIKPVRKKRLSMDVKGKTKSGKSRLIFQMPQPIGILNFDRSLDDLIAEFPDVDVIVKDMSHMISPGEALTQQEAQAIEAEFKKGYDALLNHQHVRSVGIDKGTTLWEVARYAEFGSASARAHHYVAVNLRMRGYLLAYQQHMKNVVITHDLKEEYVDEKPTGRMIIDGFKYTESLMQVNTTMWREEKDDREFKLRIDGCALNAGVVGEELEDDNITFGQIALLVLEDTQPSDWR